MRVLITGIDGFVGSHAAEFLLNVPGVEVHGTVLNPEGGRNIAHLRRSLTLHQVNVINGRAVSALVEEVRPDRLIHLAGQAIVPDSLVDPVGTFETNIIGGVSILEATRRQRQKGGPGPALLVVSTGEVYGRLRSAQPVSEEFPLAPVNPYAASKASIDLIAQQYKTSFDVNVIVARPFNHAGPRQSPAFVCSDFAKQFAEIAVRKRSPVVTVGNIDVQRDFTDVRDVVRAYWMLFERTSPEFIFNVCSGHAVRIRDLLKALGEISGMVVDIVPKPERLRSYDIPHIAGSYDRLRDATGWKPRISLKQTLRDVYAYWSTAVGSDHRQDAEGS